MITTTDGVSLHLIDEGAGPAVVLMSGYGGTARSWTPQIEALRDHHRVVAIDRRNHGRSDRPAFGQRMSRQAADLHEVLTALELNDVLLVGHSMGASIALSYLDSYGAALLRGLVLVDQTPKMINEGDWQLGYHGLTWDNAEQFIRSFPEGVNAMHRMPAPELLELALDGPDFSFEDTRALLRDHTYADWRDVVRRIPVPLTVIAGRHSPVWSWQSSAWIADNAPSGRLVILEDSGHVPSLEEPERFSKELLAAAEAPR